jgi:hypothetical protein
MTGNGSKTAIPAAGAMGQKIAKKEPMEARASSIALSRRRDSLYSI